MCTCIYIYTIYVDIDMSFDKCVAHLLAGADGTSTSGPTQSLQKVTGLPSFSYAKSDVAHKSMQFTCSN